MSLLQAWPHQKFGYCPIMPCWQHHGYLGTIQNWKLEKPYQEVVQDQGAWSDDQTSWNQIQMEKRQEQWEDCYSYYEQSC